MLTRETHPGTVCRELYSAIVRPFVFSWQSMSANVSLWRPDFEPVEYQLVYLGISDVPEPFCGRRASSSRFTTWQYRKPVAHKNTMDINVLSSQQLVSVISTMVWSILRSTTTYTAHDFGSTGSQWRIRTPWISMF